MGARRGSISGTWPFLKAPGRRFFSPAPKDLGLQRLRENHVERRKPPAPAAQRERIAASLGDGAAVRATVTARITDPDGNELRRKLEVRLLAPRR